VIEEPDIGQAALHLRSYAFEGGAGLLVTLSYDHMDIFQLNLQQGV
jgi:hypothetical protein